MARIRVLFLCTGNSARSIIAEAVLRHGHGQIFEVFSAGTEPKGINPLTIKVLEQAGLSADGLESKDMSLFVNEQFDYVITVCDRAADRCPLFPGKPERIHWSFKDPAAVEGSDVVRLAAFQETLRDMRQRIDLFTIFALRDAAVGS